VTSPCRSAASPPAAAGPLLQTSLAAHRRASSSTSKRPSASPYPYDKLDIVAVPDFGAGAMENAGLVTFRDTLLYVDDDSAIAAQKGNLGVIAHELAHQWFGNLVTMGFWDDLWLNEAFATWMASRSVHRVRPDFDGAFDLRETAAWAMGEDSLTTRPPASASPSRTAATSRTPSTASPTPRAPP
jgi:aminopeptidase N